MRGNVRNRCGYASLSRSLSNHANSLFDWSPTASSPAFKSPPGVSRMQKCIKRRRDPVCQNAAQPPIVFSIVVKDDDLLLPVWCFSVWWFARSANVNRENCASRFSSHLQNNASYVVVIFDQSRKEFHVSKILFNSYKVNTLIAKHQLMVCDFINLKQYLRNIINEISKY